MKRALALLLVLGLVGACSDSSDDDGGDDIDLGDPGDCTIVDAAISPEKIDLVTDLARTFNDSDEAAGRRPLLVRRTPAEVLRAPGPPPSTRGWDEAADGPLPVIWSPAASTWGQVVNRRLQDRGETPFVPDDFERFMLTPLVIAMPEPMAEAAGLPREPDRVGRRPASSRSRRPGGPTSATRSTGRSGSARPTPTSRPRASRR